MFNIALNTFKEIVRNKFLYLILFFAFVLTSCDKDDESDVTKIFGTVTIENVDTWATWAVLTVGMPQLLSICKAASAREWLTQRSRMTSYCCQETAVSRLKTTWRTSIIAKSTPRRRPQARSGSPSAGLVHECSAESVARVRRRSGPAQQRPRGGRRSRQVCATIVWGLSVSCVPFPS